MTTTLLLLFYLKIGMISTVPSYTFDSSLYTKEEFIQQYTTEEHKCLSEALYFEARGESDNGIIAVGNVILNRAKNKKFPDTICGVINQKSQFSYKWDNLSDIPKNKKRYQEIQLLSFDIINNRTILPNNTLYYHNHSVKPFWTKSMKCVKIIGNHIFYAI